MLRFPALAIALVAAFSLSACDNRPTPSKSEATTASAQTAAAADIASINNLSGFLVGNGVSAAALPTAYILFDPQCPHCSHLWQAAKPLQAQVQLKWIPVGILNGLSKTQAAMLIEAKDPVTLMNTNEAAFTATGRPSGASADVKDQTRTTVDKNTEILRTLGATSVPLIVYRKPGTKDIATASGSMSTEQLAALLGVTVATAPIAK